MRLLRMIGLITLVIVVSAACSLDELSETDSGGSSGDGETGRVVRVIDGDTIDVEIDGREYRVRYVGVNTPERDEVCYNDATNANRDLVEGQTVRLVVDQSETDRFDRLLRYVYVGDTFVNQALVRDGYAEAVLYRPDDRHFNTLRNMEIQAANAGRGCHPTGIFDDGNDER